MMDVQSAKKFKAHTEEAIKELSSVLLLVQQACTPEEFAAIRKSVGDVIARVHSLLHDSIYSDHPELNELQGGSNEL